MNDVQNDLSGAPLTALLAELRKRTTALLAELLKRMTANPKLLALYYLLPAAPTLAFQVSARAEQCVDAIPCLASHAKGFIWSILWPLYWPVHFAGI
jgi:hypothetical protein